MMVKINHGLNPRVVPSLYPMPAPYGTVATSPLLPAPADVKNCYCCSAGSSGKDSVPFLKLIHFGMYTKRHMHVARVGDNTGGLR